MQQNRPEEWRTQGFRVVSAQSVGGRKLDVEFPLSGQIMGQKRCGSEEEIDLEYDIIEYFAIA